MSNPANIRVNNHFYNELGDRWYTDDSHVIALLRAETSAKLEYIKQVFMKNSLGPGAHILDIACGAGLCTNPLAAAGFQLTGIDCSETSLYTARQYAPRENPPQYKFGDAYKLDEPEGSYDAVLIMDFLEHVEEPQKILAQASRLVRDGGPVIFHTFNRTIAARFLAIKAVEWIARDCPQHFHVYDLFIPPTSLYQWAATEGLQVQGLTGIRPKILSRGFWLSILQRRVHPRLEFQLTGSLTLGYLGYATKQGPSRSATLVSHKTIQSVSKILH